MSSNTLKALEYGVGLIGIPYGYWEGGENQKCHRCLLKMEVF